MNTLDAMLAAKNALKNTGLMVAASPNLFTQPAVYQPPVPAAVPQRSEMDQQLAAVQALPKDYSQYVDVQRITAIPVYRGMSPDEVERFNAANVMAEAYNSGFRLHKCQCEALDAYNVVGGLLGPIGVGWGKTLISLGIANIAWNKGIEWMMLFIPSTILPQLVNTDISFIRNKIPINYDIHILGGRESSVRKQIVQRRKKGLYVMTYSLLSAKDASDIITGIEPGLIIEDEAHKTAKISAARSKRIRDFIENKKPKFVALSGTITDKTYADYYPFAKWALGDLCPLPLSASLAHEWGTVIDATAGKHDGPANTGSLQPLVHWARRNFTQEPIGDDVSGFRRAYRLRLNSTPGVVSTGDADIKNALVLVNEPVKDYEKAPAWAEIDRLITQVEECWMTPNGDEIDHAIHMWKWLNELNTGFYNQLTWPVPEQYNTRAGISLQEATDRIERAKEHHSLGQIYAKHLRQWLEAHAKPNLDTPFLVGRDMFQNAGSNILPRRFSGSATDLYADWKIHHDAKALYELDFKTPMLERDSTAIRVSPFKIQAAVDWVNSYVPAGEGAIIWYHHIEIGKWLTEAMTEETGREVLYAPAGENEPIGDVRNKHKIIVASETAHGTGKNLQHMHHQYCVQWPRSAKVAEQLIGRTHRNGQLADEVLVHTNHTTLFDILNFAACLNDALYIHQTTGNRQKLIVASYNPTPKIFPSAVLHEKGLLNKILTHDQQKQLNEKFTGQA